MTNNIQETTITEDDEPFFIQQGLVDKTLESVRAQLDKVSPVTACIDCGEDIGAARKAAVPSAVRCIDCETSLQDRKSRNALR